VASSNSIRGYDEAVVKPNEVAPFRFTLRELMFAMAVIGICAAGYYWYRQYAQALLLSKHFKHDQVREYKDHFVTRRVTYNIPGYGVTEIGNLRLAWRGAAGDLDSSSGICIDRPDTPNGSSNSTGVGRSRFAVKTIPGGSRCYFNNMTFDVVHKTLILDGKEFDVLGPPTLIIIGKDSHIESVRQIGE